MWLYVIICDYIFLFLWLNLQVWCFNHPPVSLKIRHLSCRTLKMFSCIPNLHQSPISRWFTSVNTGHFLPITVRRPEVSVPSCGCRSPRPHRRRRRRQRRRRQWCPRRRRRRRRSWGAGVISATATAMGWLVVSNMNLICHHIYIYMGCHPSHWRSLSFFKMIFF